MQSLNGFPGFSLNFDDITKPDCDLKSLLQGSVGFKLLHAIAAPKVLSSAYVVIISGIFCARMPPETVLSRSMWNNYISWLQQRTYSSLVILRR